MEISYKRDVAHSFLVIRPEEKVDTKAYPVRMILGNVIPGLLPCRLQKADGSILLYYDITARQQLPDVYQKLTFSGLRGIYQELLRIFEQMKMYLLDMDQLLLEPEYVYMDKHEGTMYLCYLPGHKKPVQEQLRYFTEYLLPRMDHQDARGVRLGYSIYRLLVDEGFQMEAVRKILHKEEKSPEQLADTKVQNGDERGESEEKESIGPESSREGRKALQKKPWVKDGALLLIGLLLFGCSVAFRQMGYFTYISLPVMLAVLFCIVLGTGLLLWSSQEKNRKSSVEEEDKEKGVQDVMWKATEPSETMCQEMPEEADIEETVILYRAAEYGSPALVSEEAGQAPSIILDQEMLVIGKMDGVSDILLDRPSISRIHAKIQRKEDGYWIADLNSKNGTFINGRKLEKEEEYLLCPEDQIVFADTHYRFIKNS